MDNFLSTSAGREFRESTLPRLTKAMTELANSLKRENNIEDYLSRLTKRVDDISFELQVRKNIVVPCAKKEMTQVLQDAFEKGYLYVNHYVDPCDNDCVVLILEVRDSRSNPVGGLKPLL